jgi:regulatory protein RepA
MTDAPSHVADEDAAEREAIQAESHVLPLTTFADTAAARKQEARLSWIDLVERVREPKRYPTKAAMPLIKMARFGDLRTDKGSLRHDANVVAISGIEGDYDAGQVSLADAATQLAGAGISAVLYSSPNSTPMAPRWRVLCPLTNEHAPSERRALVGRLNRIFGGILAPESFALSQSFYIGRAEQRDDGTPAGYESQEVRGPRYLDECTELEPLFPINGSAEPSAAADALDDPIVEALRSRGLLLRALKPGTYAIRCPWESEHTGPTSDTATAYLQPRFDGRTVAGFKCLHGHCAGRTFGDLRAYLGGAESSRQADEHGDEQSGEKPKAESALIWRLPEPIGEDEFDRASLAPPCIVRDYLFADVAVLIAPGGTGKTTLELYEAAHIALARPLFDMEVQRPGPVLILTAEDSREMLVARLRAIAQAMELSPAEIAKLHRDIRISDVSGEAVKLTIIAGDIVVPAPAVDDIIEQASAIKPVLVVIDPAVSFGVGEARINDAEQGLVDAARRIRRELGCCVRYVHHSGKQNARDKVIDQYAGRGGSALPDGARMVAVLQPLSADEWSKATGSSLLKDENGMLLARPKLSYAPPQPDILISRKGYCFAHTSRLEQTKAQELAAHCDQVAQFLTAELAKDSRHTQNSLMAAGEILDLSQHQVRAAVATLLANGRIEHADMPGKIARGPRTYLRPIAVSEKAAA